MNDLHCSRCAAPRALEDNFCRRCGHQVTLDLPVVQPSPLALRTPALPTPLVRSVAVLAVGTGLEWLVRRLGPAAARAAGRALISGSGDGSRRDTRAGEVVVDELLYVRKLEMHR